MLITNALLASGAAYAYIKQRRAPQQPQSAVLPVDHQEETENARHYSAMATASVGLSLAGLITATPLHLLSVPINVYTNLPIYQEAIATLGGKDEKLGSILWSLLVSGTLATNHVLTASLLDWVAQRSRLTRVKLRRSGADSGQVFSENVQQWLGGLVGRKPANAWVVQDEVEAEIPFEDLTIGDVAIFRKGDFVSVTGAIVKGEAELFDWSLLQAPPTTRAVGDTVKPRMMVIDGVIYVEVENLS